MRFLLYLSIFFLLPYSIIAQQSKPSLTRHRKDRIGTSFKIPLTQFCIVQHADISNKYTSGWLMDWDVVSKPGINILFLEMNPTEVEGWLGNDEIAGSFQLSIEFPDFKDSIILQLANLKKGKFNFSNAYGDWDSKDILEGSIKLFKQENKVFITSNVKAKTHKPLTLQEITLDNEPITAHTTRSFAHLMKEKNEKQEKEMEEFVSALTEMINTRDSIWEETEREAAKFPKEPFNGNFRFWISDVNKAGYNRITYFFTEDSIIIKEGPYDFIYFASNYAADSVYFSNRLPEKNKAAFISLGEKIKKDSLENSYTNFCTIDGLILVFHFEWPELEKSVTISNYYKEEIAEVLNYINTIVPEDYKINYPKDFLLKQQKSCDLNR